MPRCGADGSDDQYMLVRSLVVCFIQLMQQMMIWEEKKQDQQTLYCASLEFTKQSWDEGPQHIFVLIILLLSFTMQLLDKAIDCYVQAPGEQQGSLHAQHETCC